MDAAGNFNSRLSPHCGDDHGGLSYILSGSLLQERGNELFETSDFQAETVLRKAEPSWKKCGNSLEKGRAFVEERNAETEKTSVERSAETEKIAWRKF